MDSQAGQTLRKAEDTRETLHQASDEVDAPSMMRLTSNPVPNRASDSNSRVLGEIFRYRTVLGYRDSLVSSNLSGGQV